jgi:hypothetical protein
MGVLAKLSKLEVPFLVKVQWYKIWTRDLVVLQRVERWQMYPMLST